MIKKILFTSALIGSMHCNILAYAEDVGSITCTLDGQPWSDNKAIATQTGHSMLNIASDGDRTESISVILSGSLEIGTYNFNRKVSGSYTDASGASFGSKDGTGVLTVTKYSAPQGKTLGSVEGTFSGTFALSAAKTHSLTSCSFSMPITQF